jgi:hypothetical protein
MYKALGLAGYRWLMPVILTTQEAKIIRILIQGQPGQNESKMLPQKDPTYTKRAGRVA